MNNEQIDSFWSKVKIPDNKKECWEWMGAKKPKGYGLTQPSVGYIVRRETWRHV